MYILLNRFADIDKQNSTPNIVRNMPKTFIHIFPIYLEWHIMFASSRNTNTKPAFHTQIANDALSNNTYIYQSASLSISLSIYTYIYIYMHIYSIARTYLFIILVSTIYIYMYYPI